MSDFMEIDNTTPTPADADAVTNSGQGDVTPTEGTSKDILNAQKTNSENATTDTSKPKKKRFEIKKWTAVAFWSWDQSNETCAICRNHLMELCIECQNKADASVNGSEDIKCPRAVGRCNHSFHLHCISTWIKNRNSCPLDSTEWAMKEILDN